MTGVERRGKRPSDNTVTGMKVLIVESNPDLGELWRSHLERLGAGVTLVRDQESAILALNRGGFDVIVLDLLLERGSALAVSDFASFRHPRARVIFVSSSGFFSDGSIFAHSQNACAHVPADTRPEDLAAMVEHYAASSRARAAKPLA